MGQSERRRLLIALLIGLLAAGAEARPAAGKTKVIYLPRDVKVFDSKTSYGGREGGYLLSKGADLDYHGWDGTLFIEEGAKLSITHAVGGRYAVFIKKDGELAGEADNHTLLIYYEKGAKIDKRIGDRHVRIECDSLLFKPFHPALPM